MSAFHVNLDENYGDKYGGFDLFSSYVQFEV